jgi:hypothetical protein
VHQMMKVSNLSNVDQQVAFDGNTYVIPAHASTEIPSRYRMAIWQRRCDDAVCRTEGLPWCTRAHKSGIIVGGLAPKLIDEGDVK